MSAVQQARSNIPDCIARIAGVIGSDQFPNGERAALRRMNPRQNPPLAFYRFAFRHLPNGWERSMEDWITLVAGIALMSPQAHTADTGLGAALANCGFSEARLERLLAADTGTRRILLLRTARFLRAKNASCNWIEPAWLLLSKDNDRREQLHRRIAGDYYQIVDKE